MRVQYVYRTFLLVFTTMTTFLGSFAQTPDLEWVNVYQTSDISAVQEQVLMANGDIVIRGWALGSIDMDPSASDLDFGYDGAVGTFMQRISPDGVPLWTNYYENLQNNLIIDRMLGQASGELLILGSYTDTVDFDASEEEFIAYGNSIPTLFLLTLDNEGSPVNLIEFDSSGLVGGITASTPEGGTLIAGTFNETIDLDPGVDDFSLQTTGFRDIFISKYGVAGNLEWGFGMGGPANNDGVRGLALDCVGNITLLGRVYGMVDLDPGPLENMVGLESGSTYTYFLAKYSASGDFIWSKSFEGMGYYEFNGLSQSAFGDMQISGLYEGQVDLDPNAGEVILDSPPYHGAFTVDLDPLGNYVSSFFLESEVESGVTTYGNYISPNGDQYVSGLFTGSVDFDNSTNNQILSSSENGDFYLLKKQGSSIDWVINEGGSGYNQVFNIVVDDQEDLYASGFFSGTIDIDPSSGTEFITASGQRSSFIFKLDLCDIDGSVSQDLGVLTASEQGASYQWYMCTESGPMPIIGETSVEYSPSDNGVYMVQITNSDCSTMSSPISLNAVGIEEIEVGALAIYPNPTHGPVRINAETSGQYDLTVVTAEGRIVLRRVVSDMSGLELNLSSEPNGIYHLVMTSGESYKTTSIVKL